METNRHPRAGANPLTLEISAFRKDGDLRALTGFANVVACDDHGNFLTCGDSMRMRSGFRDPFTVEEELPDRWREEMKFQFPDIQAHKLSWLQADLLALRPSAEGPLVFPFMRSEIHARPRSVSDLSA